MPRDIDIFFFRNNEIPMWEVSEEIYNFLGVEERWNLDHQTQKG